MICKLVGTGIICLVYRVRALYTQTDELFKLWSEREREKEREREEGRGRWCIKKGGLRKGKRESLWMKVQDY